MEGLTGPTHDIACDKPAESALFFSCHGEELLGIVSRAPSAYRRGVLIVTGGPQYRVGSHRQFVHLGRRLAAGGYTCMRFDYRGMGDSTGAAKGFEEIGPDITAAIDALMRCEPTLEEIVIWGLCDAASAALMYGTADPRVTGLVLVNPWVRSEGTFARTQLKHYYLSRMFQADFWLRVLRGQYSAGTSIASLAREIRRIVGSRPAVPAAPTNSFQAAMARGLARFQGEVLVVLSGIDWTAREFEELTGADPAWRGLLARERRHLVRFDDADHTFSSRSWRSNVEDCTLRWLAAW